MLLGQNSGRHQHRHLLAIHNCLEGSTYSHLGFAKAHITAKEAIHRLLTLHVRLYLSYGRQLVMGFLIRESILKFTLPYSIRRKGISLIPLSLGIKVDELLGNILNRGTNLILCLGPAGAANLVESWHLTFLADVFLQHAYLVSRHEKTVLTAILYIEIIPFNSVDFLGFYPTVFTNTILGMNHIIPHVDFTEVMYAVFLANAGKPLFLTSKDILFRNYDQLGSWKLKAI